MLDFFDLSIFSSFIGVSIINIFTKLIEKGIAAKLEDSTKLTTDYSKLIKSYDIAQVTRDDMRESSAKGEINKLITLDCLNPKQPHIVFPAIYVCSLYHRSIKIHDSQNKYQLPEEIKGHFDEIMEAYKASVVYNQLNVRVDRWYLDKTNQNFVIDTSRTEYFHSLVTNRAIDYKWKNGLTVRSVLDFGPFMRSLEESRLSNHLGFNGFIEFSDGMIMFVKRGAHLSIGKSIYGSSVAASLKSKYGLSDGVFTVEGLKKAICLEIRDECKIELPAAKFSLENHLIAAYRDLAEGGKPQLLLFIHLDNMTKEEITDNFIRKTKNIKNKKFATNEDGFRFLWIKRDELSKAAFGIDYMIYNKKKYRMTPSTVASIVLLLNHFNELERS